MARGRRRSWRVRKRSPPLLSRPWTGFGLSFKIHCGLLGLVLLVTALDTVLTPPGARPPSIGWVVELVLSNRPATAWLSALAPFFLFLWTPAILLLAIVAGVRSALRGDNTGARAFGAAFAASAAISAVAMAVPLPGSTSGAVDTARAFLCFAGIAAAPAVLLLPFRDPDSDPGRKPSYPSLLLWALLVLNLGAFQLLPAADLWRVFPAAERQGRYSTMVAGTFQDTLWIRVSASVLLVLLPALVVHRGRTFGGAVRDLLRGWRHRPHLVLGATVLVFAGGLGLRLGWAIVEIAEMWRLRILLGVGIGLAAAWFGSFALLVTVRTAERLAPPA